MENKLVEFLFKMLVLVFSSTALISEAMLGISLWAKTGIENKIQEVEQAEAEELKELKRMKVKHIKTES